MTSRTQHRTQWIADGDRSHPHLVALDKLSLNFEGWETLVAKAEEAHTSSPSQFKDFLFELQERQKLSEGNRDHERLRKLDALKPSLSYDEWERDFQKAEEYHLCFPDLFWGKLYGMGEKQRIYNGDRSHSNLVELDRLANTLTYPNFQSDVAKAEEIHTSKPFMFREKLFEIQQLQKMHVGDRSHERLVRLDSIKFNYPGYKEDIKKAEHYHAKYPDLFYGRLEGMHRKQQVHDGNRDHPNLVLLDQIKHNLEYDGHEEDVKRAEFLHTNSPTNFKELLFEIDQKQKMHIGDRSHARLKELDEVVKTLTYPGWREDVKKCEQYHLKYHELFYGRLVGIKEKQRIFNGSRTRSSGPSCATKKSKSPPQSSDEDDSRKYCVVCLKEERTHAFFPCSHLCVCETCSDEIRVRTKMCPICRGSIKDTKKIFLS